MKEHSSCDGRLHAYKEEVSILNEAMREERGLSARVSTENEQLKTYAAELRWGWGEEG